MRIPRIRRKLFVAAVLATTIGATGTLTSCSPTVYSNVRSTGGIYDATGSMMFRIGNVETIGYDADTGQWVQNTGVGDYQRVGWNAILPSSYWYAIPIDASGPVGPRRVYQGFWGPYDNRYSIANFDVKFGIDYGGVHVGIPEGTCYLKTWYNTTGSAFTSIDHDCTNVRAYATNGTPIYPAATITGPYASLSPAQKAHVQSLITQMRVIGDRTMKGVK